MKTNLSVFVLVIVVLTGCATPYTVELSQMPGENRIAAADCINANLSPEIGERPELLYWGSMTNERLFYATGATWRRVFVGQAGTPATLELITTRLSTNIEALGFTRRITYDVDARLTVDGKSYLIHATGTRASAMSGMSATRQAVELAVVDMAQQAKAIFRSVHPSVIEQPLPSAGDR